MTPDPRPSLRRLTRNVEAPQLLEGFFVAAVASFLSIRAFLAATGYPRIGANGLHIAHMLWGGLLMLLALMLLLSFLDRSIQQAAAVIAGLGFGTFIDEIGKFVTADNNYFYRPAVSLAYGLLVVTFLVARAFVGQRRTTGHEALANALNMLAAAPDGPLEPEDRARIARLLDLVEPGSKRAELARRYLAEIPGEAERLSVFERIGRRVAAAYEDVMSKPWAIRALTAAVLAYAALAVVGAVAVAMSVPGDDANETIATARVAQVGSTIAGAVLVARGVTLLPSSRFDAYQWFMRGFLVWILVTQVFIFYSSQLAGLAGLGLDLVAYAALRLAVIREQTTGRDRPRVAVGRP
ncbi:MAG: hypothetical protein HY264_03925 [Chloroflexi bacterium]|nr:hypothetical protein [Chloroflexota bacterium]